MSDEGTKVVAELCAPETMAAAGKAPVTSLSDNEAQLNEEDFLS